MKNAHLSLISNESDGLIGQIRDTISQSVVVEGRADVERVLNAMVREDRSEAARTLDLIGHSTPDRSLLVLGNWVLDGSRWKVTAFFRGLADEDVWARLGITAIRLLGCETAATEAGRSTLLAISDAAGLPCFGTTQMIDASAYDRDGFRVDRESLLRTAELPAAPLGKAGCEPYRRVLDVELLPASPLGRAPSHPRRLASPASARQLLAVVRRAAGAQMPGVLSTTCEVALPALDRPGWFHRVDVVLDGEFVRVFPDGDDRPGVMFPVDDVRMLRMLLDDLPTC